MINRNAPPTPWEAEEPGNLEGTTRALTTLAAMPRRSLWRTRLMFLGRRTLGPPGDLERLSFIHFARTALITRLESRTGGADRLAAPFIYFESHFNGRFDDYIDAFAYVVPQHMRRIWSNAYGFPGPQPATTFKAYIREHDYEASAFYSAYPQANATEIIGALAFKKRFAKLAQAAGEVEAEEFADRWYDTLRDPGPRNAALAFLDHLRRLVLGKLRRRDVNFAVDGQVYGLTVLTPVLPGREDALRQALAAVKGSGKSPFAALPRTHFVRLVLIDRFPGPGPGASPGVRPHLLFSCIIDGGPDSYLRSLCGTAMAPHTDSVWGNCAGAPAPASGDPLAFQRWMRAHQLRTATFFAPYGAATVTEVEAALKLRRETRDFAVRTQYAPASVLQREFLREFVDSGTLP